MRQLSNFTIIEESRAFAPVTIRSEDLIIGRSPQCGLQISDPTIPLALGGIKKIESHFYFLPFGPSRFDDAPQLEVTVNGRQVTGDVALAAGDVIVIGEGCRVLVETDSTDSDALILRVGYPVEAIEDQGLDQSVSERPVSAAGSAKPPPARRESVSHEADSLLGLWIKRHSWKRGRHKVARPAYLGPKPLKGKPGTEFNWSPTRDLVPAWPASFLVLCVVIIVPSAWLAFVTVPSIFAPGKVSGAHTRKQSLLSPAIAAISNSGSCLNCHTAKGTIDSNCEGCHQADGFHAGITEAHRDAGVTCTSCHTEHQGADFSPRAAAFDSCAACHNDNNKQTYNGKTVHTPHGGTLGYPTSGGKWIWRGLDEEGLKLKPEVSEMWSGEYDEQTWRKVQFHAIHLSRVKAAYGIAGVQEGTLSCSSCHNRFDGKFDRETPRQTCDNCHHGYIEERTQQSLVPADKPNCTSCHVQHYYDSYRWGDLLTASAKEKARLARDKKFIDAVKQSAGR